MRGGFTWHTLIGNSLLSREVRVGTQVRVEAGAWVQAVEKCYWLVCPLWLSLRRGGAVHSAMDHTTHWSRKCPKLMKAIVQQVPSSHMTPMCIKLTKTNQHRVQLATQGERSPALNMFSTQGHCILRCLPHRRSAKQIRRDWHSASSPPGKLYVQGQCCTNPKALLSKLHKSPVQVSYSPCPLRAESHSTIMLSWRVQAPRLAGPKSQPWCEANAIHHIVKLTGLDHSISQEM